MANHSRIFGLENFWHRQADSFPLSHQGSLAWRISDGQRSQGRKESDPTKVIEHACAYWNAFLRLT